MGEPRPAPNGTELCLRVLNSLRQGIYALDHFGRCTFINAAALAMLGLDDEDVLGRGPHGLFHGAGRGAEAMGCPACWAAARGLPWEAEDTFLCRGGGAFAVHLTATPLCEAGVPSGAVVAFVAAGVAAADQQGRSLPPSLAEQLVSAADAVLVLENGRVLGCSDPALRLLGFQRQQDVLSRELWEFAPEGQPDGRPSRDRFLEAVAEATERGCCRFSWVCRPAGGREVALDVTLEAAQLGGRRVLRAVCREGTTQEPRQLESDLRILDIVDLLPDATLVIDRQGTVLAWNRAMEVMTGVPASEILGKGEYEYALPFYGERRPILIDLALHFDEEDVRRYPSLSRDGDVIIGESYTPNLPAGNVYLFATAGVLRNGRGEVVGAIESIRDITGRKLGEDALHEAETRFRSLFEHSRDALMTLSPPSWCFTSANPAALQLFGIPDQAEFTLLSPWDLSPAHQPDGVPSSTKAAEMIRIAMREGSHYFEWTHTRRDGHRFVATVLLTRMEILGQSLLQATVRDITEQKRAQARIQRLAHFDALTGLPNRALLVDRAAQAIASVERRDKPLAVLFLDLDRFKEINDTLGHRGGDRLLVELARRLRKSLRASDTVARLAGDEFVLLLPDTDATGAAHVAEKLLDRACQPYHIEGREILVRPSVGIAMFPEDGSDFDALCRAADSAMYAAKREGRKGFCFFTPAPA